MRLREIKFCFLKNEKMTGKFNLSSNVENNQDVTITLNVLE